jgi:transcriptional regulator with XRE-family HTH domain
VKNLNASLGAAIKNLRTAAGISQEELADRASIHRTYVSQLERGLKSPTIQMIFQLANALKTTPSEILRTVEKDVGARASKP